MTAKEREFVATVKRYYKQHGRHTLPWRKTKNPYRILVSEIMLQQTQVDRVLPKYRAFLRQFPSVGVLAAASLGDVLRAWQGLGYNRRAKYLHRCAQVVMEDYNGNFPKCASELQKLPGVGPYTAGAVMAFAYNEFLPVIETNIRTVYLHHFFKNKTDVSDADILRLVEKTADRQNIREWYAALMDYGVYVKRTNGNVNVHSKHYVKQSGFDGSNRQLRGLILQAVTAHETQSLHELSVYIQNKNSKDIKQQVDALLQEGMLQECDGVYVLPNS